MFFCAVCELWTFWKIVKSYNIMILRILRNTSWEIGIWLFTNDHYNDDRLYNNWKESNSECSSSQAFNNSSNEIRHTRERLCIFFLLNTR